MSSDTLSQGDIDKLLGNAAATAATTAAAPARADVQVYDFRRPYRVSKERLRTLEAMHERLAKSLEAWLIGRVRRQVTLRVISVEQLSYGEFTLSLPTPCASFGFDIRNCEGRKGVIDVGHEFAYFLVDRLFGGGTAPPLALQRGLTPIERLAVRVLVDRLTTLIQEIWQDHVTLDLELTTFESFPDMIQAANPDDPVLVATIEAAAGQLRALIVVCLPFDVLDKFFSSGDRRRVQEVATTEPERRMTREAVEASLRKVHVDLAVRLPTFRVPMRQLLGLPVGAVLATGIPTDAPLSLLINDALRFRVAPGRVGQQIAVRILEPIDSSAPTRPFPE